MNQLQKGVGDSCIWARRSFTCFIRFDNRHVLKCYIPISFFFARGKCAEMPVYKGLNAHSEVLKTFEVRY